MPDPRAPEIATGLAAYAAEGTGHVIAALEPTTPEAVERFGDTVRAFRAEIQPARV